MVVIGLLRKTSEITQRMFFEGLIYQSLESNPLCCKPDYLILLTADPYGDSGEGA